MKIEKITPQIAALYLGQKCENSNGSIYTVSNTDILSVCSDAEPWRKLTLHLRRLESMTEEEAREVYEIEFSKTWLSEFGDCSCLDLYLKGSYTNNIDNLVFDRIIGCPKLWLHLLSKGFDLLGLIDAGLAKDVNALK